MAARAVAFDLVERAAVAVFFGVMACSLLTSWQESGNIVSLVLLLSESSVVVFRSHSPVHKRRLGTLA